MKSFRRIISIILTFTIFITTCVGFSACSKSDNAEGKMLVSDYLVKVIDDFNMNPDSEKTTPETALEIAKEWRVIDNNDVNLKKPVTEGFVLVTLVKTVGFCDVDSLDKYEIADYAVENNYNGFKYKDKKDFNKCPSKVEVIDSINKANDIWKNPNFEKTSDIEYKEGVADLSEYSFDEKNTADLAPVNTEISSSNNNSGESFENSNDISNTKFKRKQVVINGKADIKKGQTYVSPTVGTDAANEMYVADKVEYVDGKTYITNSDEEVNVEGTFVKALGSDSGTATDLTSMPIVDGDGKVHYPEYDEDDSVTVESVDNTLQNISPTYMTYNPNDSYEVKNVKKSKERKFSVSFGELSAEVTVKKSSIKFKVAGTVASKENKSGNLKGKLDVNKAVEIKDIGYDYNYNLLKKNAYLNTTFTKVDTTGVSLKGSFEPTHISKIKIDNRRKFARFVKSKTLATIPIASAGPVSISIVVKFKVSLSGSAEFVVTTQSNYGLDVKNGKLRFIKDEKKEKNVEFNAGIEATVYVGPALCVGSINIVSFGFEAGVGAEFKATFHVVDSETNLELFKENFDSDISANINIDAGLKCDVCTDLKAYFILRASLDTDCLIAEAFKLSFSYEFFGKKNASFIDSHFEDGKKVKKCTRQYIGTEGTTKEDVKNYKDSIELSAFSMTVFEGDNNAIQVIAVPKGYKSSELIYESDDTKVATVSSKGMVNGKKSGTAIISVYTKDKKYKTSIAVSVMKKLSVPSYQSEYEVKMV